MDFPALCTCKMMQDSGRCHLKNVGPCFVGGDLSFPGGYCFAPVSCAPVTACTAAAAVAELYSLYRVDVNSFLIYYQGVVNILLIFSLQICVASNFYNKNYNGIQF